MIVSTGRFIKKIFSRAAVDYIAALFLIHDK